MVNSLCNQILDISVLENFHVCETFKVIFKEGNNLFQKLTREQFRTIRRRIIECILATDMANHMKMLNEFKSRLYALDIKEGKNLQNLIQPKEIDNYLLKNSEMQQMILSECVHTADLSNPAKLKQIFSQWTKYVYEEFFKQGDTEKELDMNVSMLCDRYTTNIHKSQVGFIKFVVMPQFERMLDIIPEVEVYRGNLLMNLKYSEDEVEKDAKEAKEAEKRESTKHSKMSSLEVRDLDKRERKETFKLTLKQSLQEITKPRLGERHKTEGVKGSNKSLINESKEDN